MFVIKVVNWGCLFSLQFERGAICIYSIDINVTIFLVLAGNSNKKVLF